MGGGERLYYRLLHAKDICIENERKHFVNDKTSYIKSKQKKLLGSFLHAEESWTESVGKCFPSVTRQCIVPCKAAVTT